jgi:hypothetical protein
MQDLTNLNLDAMRAELAYRQTLLPAARSRRGHHSHWWQRLALVPKERS